MVQRRPVSRTATQQQGAAKRDNPAAPTHLIRDQLPHRQGLHTETPLSRGRIVDWRRAPVAEQGQGRHVLRF